ncbi:hypothetical protein [Microbacterium sp. 18062]|uniref:hypothetical protein n=1 Tax=Microbacterium sp. 18062 TaxID=2681410 RepID=UPI001359E813|nr:hypothetical protein [Microbacterium sp. 18062]
MFFSSLSGSTRPVQAWWRILSRAILTEQPDGVTRQELSFDRRYLRMAGDRNGAVGAAGADVRERHGLRPGSMRRVRDRVGADGSPVVGPWGG